MAKKIVFMVLSFLSLFGLLIGLDMLQGIKGADFWKEARFYFGTLELDDYFSLALWLFLIIFYLYKVPNQL